MMIINGQKIAENLLVKLKRQVSDLKNKGITPKLGVVLVGRDKPSLAYVHQKEKACRKIGIDFKLYQFSKNISTKKLCQKIKNIQRQKLSGLIIQLPLPKHLHVQQVLDSVNPKIDVDCLTSFNIGKLATETQKIMPPTCGAILDLLNAYKINLKGKHIVVVGRGDLVGKPLSILLTQKLITLTVCTKFTEGLGKLTKQADVLISGVGKPNLIRASMVKNGAVVIDAGFYIKDKKIYGDVDFEKIKNKTFLISPVPGGVGPVTVAKLLENVIKVAFSAILSQK
jgi:methylenetetrahydrofolate dehydrogenase (NADP+)/methenyltetrahydrofolate cyclohydrolase